MKKLLFILLLAPLFSLAQESADTLSFNYIGVESVDSVTGKTLFSRAKLFVAQSFKSAKDVIQMDDHYAGMLVVKGNIVPLIKIPLVGKTEYGYAHFTMKIQVKDGKYKYTLSDFDHEAHGQNQGSGGPMMNPKPACGTFVMSKGQWRQIKEDTNSRAVALIEALRFSMNNREIGKKDDF